MTNENTRVAAIKRLGAQYTPCDRCGVEFNIGDYLRDPSCRDVWWVQCMNADGVLTGVRIDNGLLEDAAACCSRECARVLLHSIRLKPHERVLIVNGNEIMETRE